MTTNDTSTEAVERLLDGVTPGPWAVDEGERYCDVVTDYGAFGEDFVICEHAHRDARFIAAARDLVPALLKERDEARARAAAAFEMAADLADTTFSCSGTDAAHIIRNAIRALATNQERDALAKIRAEAMREAVAWFKPIEDAAGDAGLQERREGLRDAARSILARAEQIEKGEL